MRGTKNRIAVVLLLVFAIACATSKPPDATTAMYRTVGSVKLTVDTAMRGWGLHVVKNHPPKDQEDKVREAFDKYRATARTLAVTLTATNDAPTPGQLAEAAAAIVSLVETFTGKKVVVPQGGKP